MDVTRSGTTGKSVTYITLLILTLVGVIGSIISCTKIGNDPEYDAEVLARASEFQSTSQYETVSI